jgi:hypothetical protein
MLKGKRRQAALTNAFSPRLKTRLEAAARPRFRAFPNLDQAAP